MGFVCCEMIKAFGAPLRATSKRKSINAQKPSKSAQGASRRTHCAWNRSSAAWSERSSTQVRESPLNCIAAQTSRYAEWRICTSKALLFEETCDTEDLCARASLACTAALARPSAADRCSAWSAAWTSREEPCTPSAKSPRCEGGAAGPLEAINGANNFWPVSESRESSKGAPHLKTRSFSAQSRESKSFWSHASSTPPRDCHSDRPVSGTNVEESTCSLSRFVSLRCAAS
mmetsp:Transcript_6664/g.21544  ORF Transcript_6664/g.21544 Transcript_6664/m.21544 type:complete len:231 (+) Transcript_6664:441-1133(+)